MEYVVCRYLVVGLRWLEERWTKEGPSCHIHVTSTEYRVQQKELISQLGTDVLRACPHVLPLMQFGFSYISAVKRVNHILPYSPARSRIKRSIRKYVY